VRQKTGIKNNMKIGAGFGQRDTALVGILLYIDPIKLHIKNL